MVLGNNLYSTGRGSGLNGKNPQNQQPPVPILKTQQPPVPAPGAIGQTEPTGGVLCATFRASTGTRPTFTGEPPGGSFKIHLPPERRDTGYFCVRPTGRARGPSLLRTIQ